MFDITFFHILIKPMWHENPRNHKDKYTKCVLEALKECEVEVGCP